MTKKHKMALEGAYGYGAFTRKVLEPLQYDVASIAIWEKSLKNILSKKKDLAKAKTALHKEETGARKKIDVLREKKDEKEMDFALSAKGLLGYDLTQYKDNRDVQAKELYEAMARFHIHGASEILNQWLRTGVKIEDVNAEEEMNKNRMYARSVVSRGSSITFNPSKPSRPTDDGVRTNNPIFTAAGRSSINPPNAPPPGLVGAGPLSASRDDWSVSDDEPLPVSTPIPESKLPKMEIRAKGAVVEPSPAVTPKIEAVKPPTAVKPEIEAVKPPTAVKPGPPGIGGANFLSQINSGALKKLNKVPDADKSEAIGGSKRPSTTSTTAAGNHQPGNLLQELAGKLDGRKID